MFFSHRWGSLCGGTLVRLGASHCKACQAWNRTKWKEVGASLQSALLHERMQQRTCFNVCCNRGVRLCASRQWLASFRVRPVVEKKRAFSCTTWSHSASSSVCWTNLSSVTRLSTCQCVSHLRAVTMNRMCPDIEPQAQLSLRTFSLRCSGLSTHSAEQSWTCRARVRSAKITHTSAGDQRWVKKMGFKLIGNL